MASMSPSSQPVGPPDLDRADHPIVDPARPGTGVESARPRREGLNRWLQLLRWPPVVSLDGLNRCVSN